MWDVFDQNKAGVPEQSIGQSNSIERLRNARPDLRRIFVSASDSPDGEAAQWFIRRHFREIVSRISYWTGESPSVVRSFIDYLAHRAGTLELRVGGLEAPVLVELTAFGTAVVMNHRYHHTLRRPARTSRPEPSPI